MLELFFSILKVRVLKGTGATISEHRLVLTAETVRLSR